MDATLLTVDDWMPLIGLVVGLVTFVLGQLFALRLADRQAKHQLEHDRESREEVRRDRSQEFQRETLLTLQDALTGYGRAVVETHAACRHLTAQAGGVWTIDTDALSEEHKALLEVSKLVTRVKDDQLRLVWNPLVGHQMAILYSASEQDADKAYLNWLEQWQTLHERLRVILHERI